MGKNKDKFDFSASNLLAYVLKRFKVLLIITIAAGILTAIYSVFIPNRYKSEVILLPTTQTSVARSIADINYGTGKGELMGVGEDEELDLLLQVVNSNDIYEVLVQRFDLMNHYKIKPGSKAASKKLFDRLSSNIKISRTEYNGVQIQVWDEEPAMAAKMANKIGDYTDSVFMRMEKDKAQKAYNLIKNTYDSICTNLNVLQDSLTTFNKKGLFDVRMQTQELTKAYYKALMKGRSDIAKSAEKQMNVLKEYSSIYSSLQDLSIYFQKQKVDLSGKLAVASIALKNDVPRKYVVSSARISDYKDTPKRSIIVIVAAIAAFFVALFAFIIAENIKRLK